MEKNKQKKIPAILVKIENSYLITGKFPQQLQLGNQKIECNVTKIQFKLTSVYIFF